jgi:ribosomal-protein-alanine N-acetyltransferase
VKHKTASAVRVRHGREGDVDAFVRIWQAIWRDGFAEMLAIDVDDSRFVMGMAHAALIPIARDIIVATLSGRVVGFVYRNLAMIDDLWVDPQVQGRGVGRLLLRRALATIAADGYRTASLDCLEANIRARQFYERQGWRPVFRYAPWSSSLTRGRPRVRFEFDLWRPGRAAGPGRPRAGPE